MTAVVQFFLTPLSPAIALATTAVSLIALECLPASLRRLGFGLAMTGAVASLAACLWLWTQWPLPEASAALTEGQAWLAEFVKTFKFDTASLGFFSAISLFTLIALVFVRGEFRESDIRAEIYSMVMTVGCGMMLLVSADSLLMIFMALELLSLPTYVLVGIRRKDRLSSEAALKYFLFGSFATVLLVFGIALLFAQFGTLHLAKIASSLQAIQTAGNATPVLALGGMALLIIAIAFKVGGVPFHMWVPDTYQGAPTSVTGFMGSGVKLAGFGLAMRVLWGMFHPIAAEWTELLAWIAVITMFVGNIAALVQDNLKRLFAYSSVSHAGYLLLGIASVVPGTVPSGNALYYYLVVYGLLFLGLFGILSLLEQSGSKGEIQDLSGLGFKRPLLGLCLAIFALSAAGIPPTAGFFAKYFVFLEAVKAGKTLFVVLGLISSLIGVFYYLRVLVFLYMKEGSQPESPSKVGLLPKLFIGLCALAMLGLVVIPLPKI